MAKNINELTSNEIQAIKRLMTAFEKMPETLNIYVVDADVIVCKKGVSSEDISLTVGRAKDVGAMLTDIHDDRF